MFIFFSSPMIVIIIQDSSGHEDTHQLTINIINVNEYSPVFTRTVYDAGELAENSLGGTVVATVSASDADAGDLGNIEYAIDEEPSRTFFKVFHFFLIFKFVVVFNVPSIARSFRDGTPIYCPLRRT